MTTLTPYLRLQFAQGEICIRLEENPLSRDLCSLLPLDLNFQDYAQTEKIAHLPRPLVGDSAAGYAAHRGDLTYYAPWGNLAIFYKDFSYAQGLVKLGHIERGLELLVELSEATVLVSDSL